jgi:hypothetical protein
MPPALGLRAGGHGRFILLRTICPKETTMWFANRKLGRTSLSGKNEAQTKVSGSRPSAEKRHLRPQKSFRPWLEALEDRLAPATFNAVDVDSLIADIHTANGNGTANTINLTPNGLYVLRGPENLFKGQTGMPVIDSPFPLTINGNEATIYSNGLSAFRLFGVASGAALTLNNVTLQNGLAKGTGVDAEGGAIFNAGTLTLSHDMIDHNRAEGTSAEQTSGADGASAYGGAIYNATGASLTMTACTLSNNTAIGGDGGAGIPDSGSHVNGGSGGVGAGGGIFINGGSDVNALITTCTITACTLRNNHADSGNGGNGANGVPGTNPGIGPGHGGDGGVAFGGGIASVGVRVAVTILDSTISSNDAQAGNGGRGGNWSDNYARAAQGGNGGTAQGGGVFNSAVTLSLNGAVALTLMSSTIAGNNAIAGPGGSGGSGGLGGAGGNGGNGGQAFGGGIDNVSGTVTILNNTISNNNAIGGNGGNGGAVTLNDATGGNGGNGGVAEGGGVSNNGGTMTLGNSTIAGGNEVTGGAAGIGGDSAHGPNGVNGSPGPASGGGIAGVTAVAVGDDIVAGNLIQLPAGSTISSDVSGFFTDFGYNFIGNGDFSPFVNGSNGDQVGTSLSPLDPKLGLLQNNGGPTQTMMPLPGSPVIDAGQNASSAPLTDQRGFRRVAHGASAPVFVIGLGPRLPNIDIGAVEYQRQDLVGRDQGSGNWLVAKSDGSSTFTNSVFTTWNTALTWVDVHRGDFSGDGRDDIVGRDQASGHWWVGVSNGTTFTTSLWDTWNTAFTWVDVKVGDFNGDGKLDIVGRDQASGNWWAALSTGSSFVNTFLGTWNPSITWVNVQVGDFNGDGKADIVGRDQATGDWWAALSTGSSFVNTFWGTWNTSITWVDVNVADLNGDGMVDIVGRDQASGNWWAALSMGSSSVTSFWGAWNPSITWVDVQVGDFNGDGKADIVGRDRASGQWWVAQSTGSASFNNIWGTWNPSITWVDVQVGDFNGDGKMDIVGRDRASGNWWVGTSTGSTFTIFVWGAWNTAMTWTNVGTGEFA